MGGNPMLRSGLSLMVNCIIEGGPNMTCASGWHQTHSNKCIKSIIGGSDGIPDPSPTEFGLAYYKACIAEKKVHQCPHYHQFVINGTIELRDGFDRHQWEINGTW